MPVCVRHKHADPWVQNRFANSDSSLYHRMLELLVLSLPVREKCILRPNESLSKISFISIIYLLERVIGRYSTCYSVVPFCCIVGLPNCLMYFD